MQFYGQPTGRNGYAGIDSPLFFYWMPVLEIDPRTGNVIWKFPFDGGYKLHVSVATTGVVQAARMILSELQHMKLPHKVVTSAEVYENLNAGDQHGKFITIYSGRFHETYIQVIHRIDALLSALKRIGVQPGPRPLERCGEIYVGEEKRIGVSGMLTYMTTHSFRS